MRFRFLTQSVLLFVFCVQQAQSSDGRTLEAIQQQNRKIHAQVAAAIVGVECNVQGKQTSGSGVVISRSGLILTSTAFIPSGTKSVVVIFSNQRSADAAVVATDTGTETCLLKLPEATACLELADSNFARVGEKVFTAANPFDSIRDGQVAFSAGSVSGIYGVANASSESNYRGAVIETDAAVNPGSEGGALIDANGRLLGIISLSLDRTRRLGTAVPIHLIKASFQKLLAEIPLAHAESDAENRAPKSNPALARVERNALATAGIVIDPRGLVLTCAAGESRKGRHAQVQLCDHRVFEATIIGADTELDAALLQLECPAGERFEFVPLSPDCELRCGCCVAALGHSHELCQTCNCGIVSATKNRAFGSAYQTDAKINAGNYGGPVIDDAGRLVGIVSHFNTVEDWSQPNCGVGFMTPARSIAAHFDGLLKDSAASRDNSADARLTDPKQTEIAGLIDRLTGCVAVIGDGSGVVVSPDGYVVTCFHIASSRQVWSLQVGGRNMTADLIDSDRACDLCVLKIRNAHDIPFARLAELSSVEVGDPVLSAGDAFKLSGEKSPAAFSFGIVSALHRNQGKCRDVLQTDAAVNPGSSGGPLFTVDGKLLAINGQIRYRFDAVANTGIGFGITCDKIARHIARAGVGSEYLSAAK